MRVKVKVPTRLLNIKLPIWASKPDSVDKTFVEDIVDLEWVVDL